MKNIQGTVLQAIAASALVLVTLPTICNAQSGRSGPPMKNGMLRANGIAHLGSKRPMPEAHVKCVKFIDDLVDWQKDGKFIFSSAVPDREIARGAEPASAAAPFRKTVEFYEKISTAYLGVDWGVPKREEALSILKRNEAELERKESELETSRENLAHAIAEGKSILVINMRLRSVFFAESGVRDNNAFTAYARCVLDNNLPATTD